MKYDFANVTILIAEEEEFNQFFFKAIFKPTNARLIFAGNGQQLIDHVENNPDIKTVLMDIELPVVDGLTAARTIKSKFKNLPLIAQTAYSVNNGRYKAFEPWFDEFITKPVNREELFKLILSCYLTS